MLWIMMEKPEGGVSEATDQFLMVSEDVLEQILRLNPSGEHILGRLGAGSGGVSNEDLDELYKILEIAWDRAQGEVAAEILKDPDLSKDLSTKAKQVARRLRRRMEGDSVMTVLDEMMNFVSNVCDGRGSISVMAE